MKPYGVKIIEWPDVGDLQAMASKGSMGSLPKKDGSYCSYIRKAAERKAVRRYWKRKARQESKNLCRAA